MPTVNGTALSSEHIGARGSDQAKHLLGLDDTNDFPIKLQNFLLTAEGVPGANQRTLTLRVLDLDDNRVLRKQKIMVTLNTVTGEFLGSAAVQMAVGAKGTALTAEDDVGEEFETDVNGELEIIVSEQIAAALTVYLTTLPLDIMGITQRFVLVFAV